MKHTIEKDWITESGLRAACLVIAVKGDEPHHRCGYVEVPKGHPLYGVNVGDPCEALRATWDAAQNGEIGKRGVIPLMIAATSAKDEPPRVDAVFNVHGGLTYSGPGDDGYPVTSDGWWFGFDCIHYGDAPITPLQHVNGWSGIVRSLEYVVAECESLARQLAAVSPATETQQREISTNE